MAAKRVMGPVGVVALLDEDPHRTVDPDKLSSPVSPDTTVGGGRSASRTIGSCRSLRMSCAPSPPMSSGLAGSLVVVGACKA
jgi:hypothetical protein